MAKKTSPKRPAKTKRRQAKKKPNQTKRWLILMVALISSAAAVYQCFPQLREAITTVTTLPSARPISDTAELQIALAREGFSPGSIDGVFGSQTTLALLAYQSAHQLPQTGTFDSATTEQLQIEEPVFTTRQLSSSDFASIDPKPQSWRARGELDQMRYNSPLEMIAEQAQCDPDYIARLNPTILWDQLTVGDTIQLPHVPPFRIQQPAAYIQITLSKRTLHVYSAEQQLLFHCPVSIARQVDKRPSGELRVKVRVENPNYTFNPAILTSTAQREGITNKFIIQPGPNNPVGTVWIGLNLPSYGIHGTPEPEKVGRTESSGCFRLANWNAQTLLEAVQINMPVYVEQ